MMIGSKKKDTNSVAEDFMNHIDNIRAQALMERLANERMSDNGLSIDNFSETLWSYVSENPEARLLDAWYDNGDFRGLWIWKIHKRNGVDVSDDLKEEAYQWALDQTRDYKSVQVPADLVVKLLAHVAQDCVESAPVQRYEGAKQ